MSFSFTFILLQPFRRNSWYLFAQAWLNHFHEWYCPEKTLYRENEWKWTNLKVQHIAKWIWGPCNWRILYSLLESLLKSLVGEMKLGPSDLPELSHSRGSILCYTSRYQIAYTKSSFLKQEMAFFFPCIGAEAFTLSFSIFLCVFLKSALSPSEVNFKKV